MRLLAVVRFNKHRYKHERSEWCLCNFVQNSCRYRYGIRDGARIVFFGDVKKPIKRLGKACNIFMATLSNETLLCVRTGARPPGDVIKKVLSPYDSQ